MSSGGARGLHDIVEKHSVYKIVNETGMKKVNITIINSALKKCSKRWPSRGSRRGLHDIIGKHSVYKIVTETGMKKST